jgi:hypothetical protein
MAGMFSGLFVLMISIVSPSHAHCSLNQPSDSSGMYTVAGRAFAALGSAGVYGGVARPARRLGQRVPLTIAAGAHPLMSGALSARTACTASMEELHVAMISVGAAAVPVRLTLVGTRMLGHRRQWGGRLLDTSMREAVYIQGDRGFGPRSASTRDPHLYNCNNRYRQDTIERQKGHAASSAHDHPELSSTDAKTLVDMADDQLRPPVVRAKAEIPLPYPQLPVT